MRDIISDPFLKLLGRYVLMPMMVLYALGLLGPVQGQLEAATVSLGNISFSVMSLLRGIIVGWMLFWLGRWSNDQSRSFIGKQEELRPATRELATKAI